MHLAVWIAKGGAGKTLLALNLAGLLAQDRRVLVVDLDPQGGATAWAAMAQRAGRETPFTVSRSRARGFDVVIEDHPPALPEQRFNVERLLIPTLLDAPTHLLYRKSRAVMAELDTALPVIAVPNRVRKDRAEQRDLLAQAFPNSPSLLDRAAYPAAYGQGLTLFADELKGPHIASARDEFRRVALAAGVIA